MKGIKRDEEEALDQLIKGTLEAKGVSLLELQIKIVVRLRKLLNAAGNSVNAKESLCADIVHRYVTSLLQWLLWREDKTDHGLSDANMTLLNTGRSKVVEDVMWILTCIANSSGDFSLDLLKVNLLGVMQKLFSVPETNIETIESGLWIVGSITASSTTVRDRVIKEGMLPIIVKCVESRKPCRSATRLAAWVMSHACGGFPKPSVPADDIIPWLTQLLVVEDEETVSHACWSLSHIIDGPSSPFSEQVLPQMTVARCEQLTKPLIQLLGHTGWRITKPALRVLGNIVCSDGFTDFTQVVVDGGVLPHLTKLIYHNHRDVRKEACWTLSNIAAGTVKQIQAIIDIGVMPAIINIANSMVARETEIDVWTEACWVLLNASSCGSDSQIHYLVKHGVVGALSGEMLCDSTMVSMALEGLERVLRVGENTVSKNGKGHGRGGGGTSVNPYAALLSEARKARSLTFEVAMKSSAAVASSERTIGRQASKIWDQHFVTCAICQSSSAKTSLNTRYCDECRGIVCSSCDCSVYHLSYQEKMWDDVSLTDAADKNKKKKKKKQKSKQKDKKGGKVESTGGDKTEGGSGSDDEKEEEKSEESPSESKESEDTDIRRADNSSPGALLSSLPENEESQTKRKNYFGNDTGLFLEKGADDTVMIDSDDEDSDDLVAYLQMTGSILALAQKMGF